MANDLSGEHYECWVVDIGEKKMSWLYRYHFTPAQMRGIQAKRYFPTLYQWTFLPLSFPSDIQADF